MKIYKPNDLKQIYVTIETIKELTVAKIDFLINIHQLEMKHRLL